MSLSPTRSTARRDGRSSCSLLGLKQFAPIHTSGGEHGEIEREDRAHRYDEPAVSFIEERKREEHEIEELCEAGFDRRKAQPDDESKIRDRHRHRHDRTE